MANTLVGRTCRPVTGSVPRVGRARHPLPLGSFLIELSVRPLRFLGCSASAVSVLIGRTATWAPKSTRTFDEVADHWMTLREADPSLGPNTVRADRESLAYARRAFGALPVQKLTPAALADWSAKLTGKGGATLAPATKRRAIVRLKSVLAHARKMRWLTYDPSADLESPEQKAITATAADDIWTPEQMSTFLDHVAAHRLGGCFGLTLLGLRREEVGGLRWSDVALESGTLRIRQARVDVNGRDTIVATKTNVAPRSAVAAAANWRC